MTVEWQPVGIPITGGVDTKTDAKALPPSKLLVLENGIFGESRTVKKRKGYTALSTLTHAATPATIAAAKALATRADELVLLDGHKAYSWAEGPGGWLDRGALESVIVEQASVAKTGTTQTLADRATCNGVTVYAWEDGRGTARCTCLDAATGAVLDADRSLGANTTRPRVVVVGAHLHVYAYDTGATAINVLSINPLDVPGTVTATPTQLVINVLAATPIYDVAAYTSGGYARALVCYQASDATATLRLLRVNESGSAHGATLARVIDNAATACAIAVDATSTYFAFAYSTTANETYIEIDAFSTLALVARDSIDAASGTVANMTLVWESATSVRAYYEETASPVRNNVVMSGSLTTSDVPTTATLFKRHSGLASKAFLEGAYAYVTLVHESTLQTSYFLARSDGLIVARVLPGLAGGVLAKASLPQVESLGSSRWAWAGIARTRLDFDPDQSTATDSIYAEKGIKAIVYDFDHDQAFRSVAVGESLYVNGGILWQYDGRSAVESGFLLWPEVAAADITTSNSSGTLTNAGVYSWLVCWEGINDKGERELSTAVAVQKTLGTSDDTAAIVVPTLAHTNRTLRDCHLAVFRTENNGTTFYRCSSLTPASFVANTQSADTVTFTDTMSDATLITQELCPLNVELDPVAPEPASVLCEAANRVYLAGFEDGCEVRASKLRSWGQPLAFNDTLAISVPEEGGPITGLAHFNEALVVFKASRIYLVTGEGPGNDSANLSGGSWGSAQLLASDTGCDEQRSIVLGPSGVYFQSAKGLYLLDRSFGLRYVGAPVETYNAQTITAATLLADANQVRFLTSSGKTLLYDYLFDQWSTFTITGVAATIWGGVYCYALANGQVREESASDFRDAGLEYRLAIETAWIKLAGVLQGFQRVKTASVLGDWKSAHYLRISVAYNYEQGWFATRDFDPANYLNLGTWGSETVWGQTGTIWGGSGSTVYQIPWKLPRQRCESIRFRFEDIPVVPAGESYELTELALWVGIKRGLHRTLAARSAGE